MTMKNKNWRILTNKEMCPSVENPTITETVRLGQVRLG
jgi:hypothetical protein